MRVLVGVETVRSHVEDEGEVAGSLLGCNEGKDQFCI